MYPNPQDVLPLPPRPDIGQYRKRARELVRAHGIGDGAVLEWAGRWVADLLEPGPYSPPPRRFAGEIADFAASRLGREKGKLSQAQFVIARAHGFRSWPALVHHLDGLAIASSGTSAFERAADAIVGGDIDTLTRLLGTVPDLIRERSTREHRATLLHYVSANGVENFRQRTPPDIVEVARLLLTRGAEVDAEADVYGGGATTLGLVVTSSHPRRMGVQIALTDLLIGHGARHDGRIVSSSLANGCPEVAAHLAELGAFVGLEEAAGLGRVDIMATLLDDGTAPPVHEMNGALAMAAWYDRRQALELLLDRGGDVTGRAAEREPTLLHIAAFGGQAGTVAMLVGRGAPVEALETTHGATPLGWALHAWFEERRGPDDLYRQVVRTLIDAGAAIDPYWKEDERLRAALPPADDGRS